MNKLKIGLVQHINSRPLTFGFENSSDFIIIYDTPSNLRDRLLNNELDLALISSIECIRNEKSLNYFGDIGVCSDKNVRSILFFESISKKDSKVYTDNGSKTSVALLSILLYERDGKLPIIETTSPEIIYQKLKLGQGSHLLIGDNAILAPKDDKKYKIIDLGEWWYQTTNLPFIFAFWAFKKDGIKIHEDLILSSLKYGLNNINKIISLNNKFPQEFLETYLKKDLHFYVTENDKKGFYLFIEKCKKYLIF